MSITCEGSETFLLINGLTVDRPIRLGSGVEILPARCDPQPDAIIKVSRSEIDLGIAAIFLRQVSSQIHITCNDTKALAILAWNTLWDAVLLSAILNCDASCNLQSDTPAESFGPKTSLHVITYHLHITGSSEARKISEEEAQWIEKHFETARDLLKDANFMNAAHAMASYNWHPHPRARLAILWSGIEGLFGIESELVFRISLYCAKFLSPIDEEKRKNIFSSVKRLYKLRSSAVHGSDLHDGTDSGIVDSAKLSQALIKQCIEINATPKQEELAP